MQAAVYHEFGGPIRVETIAIPACPDDGVLIRVKAVGVCRSDWHGWKGHDSDIQQHGLPFVPGHEVCGMIVEMGRQLQQNSCKFRIGDRVAVPFILSCGTCRYCQHYQQSTVCTAQKHPGFTQYGGFAEYLAVPRAERNLAIVPPNVTNAQAAALGCRFTTAYRAVLQQGRLSGTNDNSIAVFGCGGLGLSCIMWAVTTGCKIIIAMDVSDEALCKAQQVGATHIINTRNIDIATLQHRVEVIVQNDGVDVSVEASGFITACENAIHCTRRGGRMVQVGLLSSSSDPQQQQHPIIPMNMIAGKEIELIGSHGFAATDLPVLLDLVSRNVIDPALLIEREVTLEEGAKAIEDMDHSSPLGIIMVTKFPNENSQVSRL
jgi:alcohol dehydrogenase